jgi:uncharacterized protein (DUF934 family)
MPPLARQWPGDPAVAGVPRHASGRAAARQGPHRRELACRATISNRSPEICWTQLSLVALAFPMRSATGDSFSKAELLRSRYGL